MQRALLQPHLPRYREPAQRARRLAGAPPPPRRKVPRPGRAPAPSDSFE